MVGHAHLEAGAVIRRAVRFVDTRTATTPIVRKTLRYLFPDHWSFLLGEVALYAFLVLVATGIYLTFFFVDSTRDVVYHGPYVPLQGQHMSEAYRSVLNISTTVKAGLLIRQTQYRNLRPDQMPELVDGLHRVAESVSIVPNNGQT